jgi:hypothetical protein
MIVFGSISFLHSQTLIHAIGPFELLPQSPSLEDSIKLKLRVDFVMAYSDLSEYDVEVDELENRIRIETCYEVGPFATYSHTVDTITIGILKQKEYDLTIIFGEGFTYVSGNCDFNPSADSVKLQIHPKQGIVVNSKILKVEQPEIEINNDLTNSVIYIENSQPISVQVKIFNIHGVELKSRSVAKYGKESISISEMSPGIYICSVQSENRIIKSELIFKQ